ncbi:MAG: sigma-54-dependent Fis family transcriptional regulator [Proteobacteria bacterium]|nr:sigma-54-dependent Fis family transcriptional regulator [Pseudomonadota bacterium]
MSKRKVLVVDDDLSLRQFLTNMLRRGGYSIRAVPSGEEALAALAEEPADVVVTDLNMEGMTGMDVLRAVKADHPDTEVVMITAYATTENAVAAMKDGAFDYVVKPFNVDELKLILTKAFEKREMGEENRELRAALQDRFGYSNLVGKSQAMGGVYDYIDRVKDTPVNVLITGQSGTGKELVACAIHFEGVRKAKPFRSINCGAIPENLIESELFGHRKGAFTGAVANSEGLFASAEGGTLFLDEVGEMPPQTQVKVLRAIQERKIRQIGGHEEVSVDVRLIAATNRDLTEEIAAGRFRSDLYYRLKVVTIELPPLHERLSDLPLLIQHFLERYGEEFGRPGMTLSEDVKRLLAGYPWPGNVRELENVIQRGVALARTSEIDAGCLPPEILAASGDPLAFPTAIGPGGADLDALMESYERQLLTSALEEAEGVKKEAARLLGISFRSLRYRLQKIGMEEPTR